MNALFTDKFTYIAVALFLTLSCKVDENARKGNQGGSSSLGSGKGSILPGGKPGSGFGGGPVSEIPVPTTPPISNTGSSLAAFFSNGGSLVPVPADCKKYLDRKPVTPVAIASLAAACEINQKILEGTLKEEPVAYIGVLSVAISKGRLISRIESPWFGDRIPGITSIIPNPDNIKFKGMGTASLAMIATEFGAGTAIHKIHGPLGLSLIHI